MQEMIKATIRDDGFRIEGHANYAPSGYDIVCAAVSILVGTVLESAYGTVVENEMNQEKGVVDITYAREECEDRILLKAFSKGLHIIQEQYPHHLEVQDET